MEIIPPKLTFGTEITGIHKLYREKTHKGYVGTMLNAAIAVAVQEELKQYEGVNVHGDGHCVEISSPVFEHVSHLFSFYHNASYALQRYHCYPKHPETVCGGGHLHFGGLTLEQRMHCVRGLAERPYIPWIFTMPDDTLSCDNIHNENVTDIYDWDGKIFSINSKIHLVSTGSWINERPTLEYRCVEAPTNAAEFRVQFHFFHALTLHLLKSPITRPLGSLSVWKMRRMKPEECVYRFKLLLDLLGLDYEHYEPFVKRNLYPRWELGRSRV